MTCDHSASLRELMRRHGLRYRDVAELAMVSAKTVEGWLASPGSAMRRTVHERDIALITYRLPAWLSGNHQPALMKSTRVK